MKRLCCISALALVCLASVAAFDKGWILNMKGNVGGSLTIPAISAEDMAKLGANKMDGQLGFLGGGQAEIGFIFDAPTWFKLPEDHWFSGVGAFGAVGVGQGYAGQVSGSLVEGKQVDVYVSIFYTPVISLGAVGKAYFFDNKLAVGLGAGMKMIADMSPEYELYSTSPDAFAPEVGTILVDEWMMKNMNPVMGSFDLLVEYNIAILPTMDLILGGYTEFNVFSPKYITMPDSVKNAAIQQAKKEGRTLDFQEPMPSYFINSFDFGLTFALGFRL